MSPDIGKSALGWEPLADTDVKNMGFFKPNYLDSNPDSNN